SAARHTGTAVAAILLEDYRTSLKQIRKTGYVRYAVDQFRPYLSAAASQFSPQRQSLTERLISMAAQPRKKARGRSARRSQTKAQSRRRKKKSPNPRLRRNQADRS